MLFHTIPEILSYAKENYGADDAVRWKKSKNEIESRTYSELKDDTDSFANAIEKLGKKGQHIAVIGPSSYDIDGALIADTPGFSMIDFRGMTKLDIRDNMKEMYDNLEKCKYRDCMHIKEDDCYVKELVKNGKILKSRYENYKSFLGGK